MVKKPSYKVNTEARKLANYEARHILGKGFFDSEDETCSLCKKTAARFLFRAYAAGKAGRPFVRD